MKTKKSALSFTRPLQAVVSEAFGKYAKYIIQDRALPDLRDGLKPVQRRILYTAYINHLTWKHPHRKAAKLVGDVMGSYHPHGDSSIYEAIVRMCQPWKTNLPLLEMHGNFGSIDGDPAAAMRYTEVRLNPVSEWMLANLDKQTVEYVPNFDDTTIEPVVLPATFFNLLCNGSSGIAAGYATNIPPYNPQELCNGLIAVLQDPLISDQALMQLIPGPDFPTGGSLELNGGMNEVYATGKGKIFIHANYKIVQLAKMQQIIFYDLAYETNKSQIVAEIDKLIAENKLANVLEVRDETDKQGISIVLDVQNQAPVDIIIKYLYKNTALRTSYHINNVVIVDKKPQLLPIKSMLVKFLDHMRLIVWKAFKYDYQKLKDRLEIVEGFIKALSIIDEIIKIIRRSQNKEEILQKLMQQYLFTKNQAEAIVQLRLYKLSNTDYQSLITEKTQINQQLQTLHLIITDQNVLKTEIKKLLNQFAQTYGFARRSLIAKQNLDLEVKQDVLIATKHLDYCWTAQNTLKVMESKTWTFKDIGNIKIPEQDIIVKSGKITNKDWILLLSNKGFLYCVQVQNLEIKRINALSVEISKILNLELNETIVQLEVLSYLKLHAQNFLLLTTKQGLTKRINLQTIFKNKILKKLSVIKLNPQDQLISAILVKNVNASVCFFSKFGIYNHVLISSINVLERSAMGQRSMKLKPDDEIVQVLNVPTNADYLITWFDQGYKKAAFPVNHLNRLASAGMKWIQQGTNNYFHHAYFVNDKDYCYYQTFDNSVQLQLVQTLKTSTSLNPLISKEWKIGYKECLLASDLKYDDHPENLSITPIV